MGGGSQGTEEREEKKGREFRRPVFHRRQAVKGASSVVRCQDVELRVGGVLILF